MRSSFPSFRPRIAVWLFAAAFGLPVLAQAQANVTVQNTTYSSDQIVNVGATSTITTSGTVTVSNGAVVKFIAPTTISLQPGFTAAAGSSFKAILAAPGDTQSPSAPTSLAASGISSNVFTLSWAASSDNVGVAGYEIRRDSTSIGTINALSAAINNGIGPNGIYVMTVRAFDAAGNYSAWSSPLSVTVGDVQAPSTPTGLSASGINPTVFTLSWNASTDNVGVAGYEIRRDSTGIGTINALTAAINNGIVANTTYVMTVRAFDAAGNNSAWSSPVTVVTSGGTAQTVSISPASQTITSAQTITFTASGGNTTYVWGGSASGSGSTKSVTFSSAGTYNVTVYAQSGGGYAQSNVATTTITFNAPQPPVITGTLSYSATVNVPMNYPITATNSPTSFSATGLPSGLSINTSTGVISGTPTATGTANVSLSAANAYGTGTATLVITVSPAGDSDGDGLSDAIEQALGTNPGDPFAPDTSNQTQLRILRP